MISLKKQSSLVVSTTAAAASAKTLRACDSCVCRRARWYCAADDAFLCQNCDSSVHSANPLARRHHRVRLQPRSNSKVDKLAPAWHHGFKRKARTPRPAPKAKQMAPVAFVPEMDTSAEDGDDQQLLYQVPILDDMSSVELEPGHDQLESDTNELLAGFMQSDAELAEFAADMESLLGRGLDNNDSFSMEELGLVNNAAAEEYSTTPEVKEEESTFDNENLEMCNEMDLSRETLEINFDCRSVDDDEAQECRSEKEKKIGLALNYEEIAVEWAAQGGSLLPWVDGDRPQLGPDDCWLDHYMGMWGGGEVHGVVPSMGMGSSVHIVDEGREARVSRYREKRRTRLFSKKIRYEVRKLNAEKRPRMKGRFVKRATMSSTAAGAATFQY